MGNAIREALKVLIGQRSMWAAAFAAVAVYVGIDPDTPKIEAATAALASGGGAAVVAQLTYWVKLPKAALLKILAGSTSITYAVMQALGSTPEESAKIAEVVGGVAAGLVTLWSGAQKNTVAVPASPKLQNRSAS